MGFRWLCSHETSIKAPPPTAYVAATMNNSCFWQCAKFKKVFLIPLFFTPQYIRALLLLLFISTYFGQIHLDGNLSLTKYSIILSRFLPNKRNFFFRLLSFAFGNNMAAAVPSPPRRGGENSPRRGVSEPGVRTVVPTGGPSRLWKRWWKMGVKNRWKIL